MIWRLQVQLHAESAGVALGEAEREDFLTFMHAVMAELIKSGVIDPDIRGTAEFGELVVQLDLASDLNKDDVIASGLAAVRAAIHGAGGSTPVWPTHQEAIECFQDPATRRWALNLSRVEYVPIPSPPEDRDLLSV